MERIFCIYCKQTIQIGPNEEQICPNCIESLQVPQATLFNGIFVLEHEASTLQQLQDLLQEKIIYKGLNELRVNEFDIDEDHSIIYLKLNFNNVNVLPNHFNEFPNLIDLKITSRSLQNIDKTFKLLKIQDLSFFSCKFTNIPDVILRCQSLRHLWISGTDIQEIPSEISQLINLESLKLNNNKINVIHENIGKLLNLQIFDVGCNKVKNLPESLFDLHQLKILKLHVNFIEELPENLIDLANLQIFEVYCNHLVSLPDLPSSLEYIDLSSNFQLQLTQDYSEFKHIKLFNIAGNKKVRKEELRKMINEKAIITKLNPLSPTTFLIK